MIFKWKDIFTFLFTRLTLSSPYYFCSCLCSKKCKFLFVNLKIWVYSRTSRLDEFQISLVPNSQVLIFKITKYINQIKLKEPISILWPNKLDSSCCEIISLVTVKYFFKLLELLHFLLIPSSLFWTNSIRNFFISVSW